MSTAPFDPAILKVIRRVMPSVIAHQIVGVQPMTGPTSSIFAMRARYGGENIYGCCSCKTGTDLIATPFVVDLPSPYSRNGDPDMMIWAVQTLRGSFLHQAHVVASNDPITNQRVTEMVQRWFFADENDAFLFKMRWVGAPTP